MGYKNLHRKLSLTLNKKDEDLIPFYRENKKTSVNNTLRIIKHYLKKTYLIILLCIIIIIIYIFNFKRRDNAIDTEIINKLDKIISDHYSNSTITSIEDHLIIVAGHGISKTINEVPTEVNKWNIKSFQTEEINTFISHIITGILIAKYNKNSTLIFSGGQTQNVAGPLTEGQSYWYIANAMHWLDLENIKERATSEEFARDSYENLIFSICRYHEFTGKYPKFITLISYPYKHYRFFNLHREAIKYPEDKFQFVGMTYDLIEDGTPSVIFPSKITEIPDDLPDFELNHSISNFKTDPYGCKGVLLQKKKDRNPFNRYSSYSSSCPELKEILEYCNTNEIKKEIQWNEI